MTTFNNEANTAIVTKAEKFTASYDDANNVRTMRLADDITVAVSLDVCIDAEATLTSYAESAQALDAVFEDAIKLAIDNRLNKALAGQLVAYMLGVPSLAKSLASETESKRVQNRWDYATKAYGLPSQKDTEADTVAAFDFIAKAIEANNASETPVTSLEAVKTAVKAKKPVGTKANTTGKANNKPLPSIADLLDKASKDDDEAMAQFAAIVSMRFNDAQRKAFKALLK